eukprot:gb/GEZN01010600.1/.p1 GENE.gb/GEZN01010600.1/~~gb/GEZN01010600.1/.p1  ORF type:complete len:357 (+),score=59.67 gb/GEZN01010600.1/:141-1073(+)
MAMATAAGWVSGIARTANAAGAQFHSSSFMPNDGMEKVLIKPSGPLSLDLLSGFGGGGPSALFFYTDIPAQFMGTTPVDGWIYGAKAVDVQGKMIGVPTGSPGDIIQGKLLKYDSATFPQMLQAATSLWGGMKRQAISVIKADGSSEKAYWFYQNQQFPIYAGEELMSKKAFGTCPKEVQNPLRWGLDRELANRICCKNRHYAEHSGFFTLQRSWLEEAARGGEIKYYDPVTGDLLFTAPRGRSWEDFLRESQKHGWPSFRDNEVEWANVRCLKNGETISVSGTHLGHNLPDGSGNRYCINLVSVAGNPA